MYDIPLCNLSDICAAFLYSHLLLRTSTVILVFFLSSLKGF